MAARPAHRPSAEPTSRPGRGTQDLAALLRLHFATLREDLARKDDRERAVHRARRHVKSMRGLLRLAWPDREARSGDIAVLDRSLKSLADHLAPARDERVAARTADGLAGRCKGEAAAWLASLAQTAHAAAARGEINRQGAARQRRAIAAIETRLAGLSWPRTPDDLALSLGRWHRRARRALAEALALGDAEALHDARTSVVRVLVQVEALAAAGGGFAGRLRGLDRLRAALGEHHDLALLAHRIAASSPPAPVGKAVLAALARRQRRLEREAVRLHARWHGPASGLERKARKRLTRRGRGKP
ncbi:CHAD domain-containing protein [uncultured Alsobacter sp.]|uniref:CHAD domain-containing protein n=1 Tax=uncultured Alsobacter sp. TaxID=1748258 RepID=UPI0025E1F6C7|nr:CHAD domain-containing protein [uncultured Alsobacter sp.]